ncbi:MAG: DUF2512 family protein [Eubacteriales bacterium]
MSKTTMALISKFILTLIASWIAFSVVGDSTFTFALIVAIVGTTINYLLGDLYVLRNFGNTIASIGDGVFAILAAYIIGAFAYGIRISPTEFAVFGVIIALFEYFFHMYLLDTKEVAPNSNTKINHLNLDVEMGEDFDLDSAKEDKNDN